MESEQNAKRVAHKRERPMRNCPYSDCSFQGTEAEVEDHVVYMTTFDDPDHRFDKLRDAR